MDRWKIPDEAALRLIGQPGGLTSTGKRPRFSLSAEQAERLEYLREIDQHLVDCFAEAGPWLIRKNALRHSPARRRSIT